MRRSVVTLLLVVFGLAVTAPVASAANESAWAQTPQSAIAALFDYGAPETTKGDPFADKPRVSIYETYGFGFSEWRSPEVDEGLIPDINVGNDVVNSISNFGFQMLTLFLGLLYVVLRLAYNPEAMDLLEPVQRLGQEIFGERIFLAAFWITLCAAGLWLIARSRNANFRAVAQDSLWVAVMCLVGFAAMLWPFTLAPAVDDVLTNTMGAVNSEIGGVTGSATSGTDGATAQIHKSLVYETWCSGLLGRDAGEAIATEYCPRFLAASTFSYEELAEIDGDEDARASMSEEKYDDYQEAADDLAGDSPTAYANLTGEKPWSRFGVVFLGWFGALCAVPFLLVAGALLFFGMVVIRVALLLAPAIVVVAAFPPLKRYMLRVFDYVTSALVAALVMGVGSAGYVAIVGGLMAPVSQTSAIVAFLVLLAVTVAFWVLLKPHRFARGLSGRKRKRKGLLSETPASSDDQDTAPSTGAPTEAERPSFVGSMARGAAAGAAGTAAAGFATGGGATLAGMAAGAARGAGLGAAGLSARAVGAHAAAAHETSRAIAAHHPAPDASTRAPGAHRAELPSAHTGAHPDDAHALPPAPKRAKSAPSEDLPRAAPRPAHETVIPSRVYLAGEAPEDDAPLVPPARDADTNDPIYTIYQGEK